MMQIDTFPRTPAKTAILGALLLIGATQQVSALDPTYGAAVDLFNLAPYTFTGQRAAAGSVMTGDAGAVLTEGGASFGGSPAISVNLTSVPGRGVIARAYTFDTLTFEVASGGSADIGVRMAGRWAAFGNGYVAYNFILGSVGYTGQAFGTGYDSGLPGNKNFTRAGDAATGFYGSYAANETWTIADGAVYNILVGV